MKKVLIISIFPLILGGCNYTQNKYSTYAIKTLEETNMVSITGSALANLFETKQSFTLFTGDIDSCSTCLHAYTNTSAALSRIGTFAYCYDLSTNLNELKESVPEYFSSISTPSLRLFKDGKLTYTIEQNKLQSEAQLYNAAKEHYIKTKLVTFTTNDGYLNYLLEDGEIIYFYDSTKLDTLELYHNKFFNALLKTKFEKAAVLDKNICNNYLISGFKMDFGISDFDDILAIKTGVKSPPQVFTYSEDVTSFYNYLLTSH